MAGNKQAVEAEWLNIASAARYCGIGESAIRAGVRSGDIVAFQRPCEYGQRVKVRIAKSDLDAWMRSWDRVPVGIV